jgi:hypothetical protein
MFRIRDLESKIRDTGKKSSRISGPWGKKAPDPGSVTLVGNDYRNGMLTSYYRYRKLVPVSGEG